nr:uncharacterized protein LOC109177831 [Ipomoea batatas]
MDAICCGKMEERSSSFRRVGRSNSTLVASELEASEAARVVGYSRLSQSMRVYDEPASCRYDKRRKNKALTFLMKVFSCNNADAIAIKEQTAEKAAEQKKRQSSWLPDHRRRWPVQGWGKGMENEEKGAEVLVEQKKKRKQPIILPNPYRRWPNPCHSCAQTLRRGGDEEWRELQRGGKEKKYLCYSSEKERVRKQVTSPVFPVQQGHPSI